MEGQQHQAVNGCLFAATAVTQLNHRVMAVDMQSLFENPAATTANTTQIACLVLVAVAGNWTPNLSALAT